MHCVHEGQPVSVFRLPPSANLPDKGFQFSSRAFFVFEIRRGSLVAPEYKLFLDFRIVAFYVVGLSLRVLQLFLELLPLAENLLDFLRVETVDGLALFVDLAVEAMSTHDSPEITQRSHGVIHELAEFLTQEVVELPYAVETVHTRQMHRHLIDPFLLFEGQPGSFVHLLAYFLDQFLIGLRSELELVKRVLQLVDQEPCKIFTSFSQTGCLKVRDRSDLIAARLHCNLWKVPPGARRFGSFVFLFRVLLAIVEAVLNKLGKAVAFDHTNKIEVEVAAVPGRGFRMQRERAREAKLPVNQGACQFPGCLASLSFK